jgi:hypothetical protein
MISTLVRSAKHIAGRKPASAPILAIAIDFLPRIGPWAVKCASTNAA